MPLFEVAVIRKPTQKQIAEGASDSLALAPVAVMAKSEQHAAVLALTKTPIDKLDECEILIRPFVSGQ